MIIKYFIAALSLYSIHETVAQINRPPQMFRLFPEKQSREGAGVGIFHQEDWSFFSDAPIRCTPLVVDNRIYFGNGEGRFYCLDKNTRSQHWVFKTRNPIHSSPAYYDNTVFFADGAQSLYALDALTGKLIWQLDFENTLHYEWEFDYFQSSPAIRNGRLFIGGGDGRLRIVDCKSGRVLGQYDAGARIRSTPLVTDAGVFFGDFNGKFYCLDIEGKLKWKFTTVGDTITPSRFSYDRKAIISSPVIGNGSVVFGSRDGFLYALNSKSGQLKWSVDYSRSWIISSPVIYKGMVIQGTSDGRFVNAVDLSSGKEVWRTKTNDVIFASPTIVDDVVYVGSFDGTLYCLDARDGKRLVPGFMTESSVLSSAVFDGSNLYFGSDDGNLYVLKPRHRPEFGLNVVDSNFVFQKSTLPFYSFKTGLDFRLSEILRRRGFTQCEEDSLLVAVMKRTVNDRFKRRVVFASNYFPSELMTGGKSSLMRRFLDAGGEVVILHLNFAFFRKVPGGFRINNHALAGEILSINFGYEDTRALKGMYPSYSTPEGLKIGLPRFFNGQASIRQSEADMVYATNEIGEATAWSKHFENGGKFTQLWIDEFHLSKDAFLPILSLTGQ
ncbi:MAG TPA: PQQ-binding-like beta-propeller repeat protein [Cyclobacteriaceae bacterium]|nr:PQQ-binding-like beta-propeller repeat protein [Cyclobacteriaceae bacterium]